MNNESYFDGGLLSYVGHAILAMLIMGFTVGIESLGDVDTIAVAVQKGNTDLLDWINNEIKELGKENFF